MAATLFSQISGATQALGPVGHRGPRGLILLHLKQERGATAAELAELLSCSLNAVRHHLKGLEAEGFIGYDRTPQGVGAPAHTWRLTPAGHALFPDRYDRTVIDLLDHVVEAQGRDVAVALLEKQYDQLLVRLKAAAGDLVGDQRGEAVARTLSELGYFATWEADDEGGALVERHCPHRLVAERFPEICAAERRVLEEVLEMKVHRRCRIAGGCGTCSYDVRRETRDVRRET